MRHAVSRGSAAVFAPLDDGAVRSEAVVRRLAGAITLGLIGDGEQLPPETELATSLRVAVVTLREALADLRRRGLVETRRGRGGGGFVRVSESATCANSASSTPPSPGPPPDWPPTGHPRSRWPGWPAR